jgi:putative FmdB family regulatory protein
MPIYEYKCASCGNRFDVLQRMNEDGSSLTCPRCDAPHPEKMISACAPAGSSTTGAPSGARSCPNGFA